MSEESEHIERARKAYKAFKILRKEGLREDAASRGYYSIVHLADALFLRKGESLPKTRSGIVSRLWEMKEDIKIDKKLISRLSRLQSLREKGDYAPLSFIEEKDLDDMDDVLKSFSKTLGVSL